MTNIPLYVSGIYGCLDPNLVLINKRNLKKIHEQAFFSYLSFGDFDCTASIPDLDLALNHFSNVFNCIVDIHAPFKKVIVNLLLSLVPSSSIQSYLNSYTTEILPEPKLDSQTRAQVGSLFGD